MKINGNLDVLASGRYQRFPLSTSEHGPVRDLPGSVPTDPQHLLRSIEIRLGRIEKGGFYIDRFSRLDIEGERSQRGEKAFNRHGGRLILDDYLRYSGEGSGF